MSTVLIFGFAHWVLLWFLWLWGEELHPSVYLPDAVSVVALQWPGFGASSSCALITSVSGQVFWRLSKLCVPKCSSQLCIVRATVGTGDMVAVALLCRTRVGLVEEIASCNSVRACLSFMWFTFRFPVHSCRINVHRVKGTWQDSCFKLKIMTQSTFLCLVLTCFANSLLFCENFQF